MKLKKKPELNIIQLEKSWYVQLNKLDIKTYMKYLHV